MRTDSTDPLLASTPLLDLQHPAIQGLIQHRGWHDLSDAEQIGAAYDFVRNEIRFGYNRRDETPASVVLAEGMGQCNTKAILLMALLRALGRRCVLHGFTIDKDLQRGAVPPWAWPLAPQRIVHSWVEVELDGQRLELEGFILDQAYLAALQKRFPLQQRFCGYGAATPDLQNPDVAWSGRSTYIQRDGIAEDFGCYDSPDDFFALHRQALGPIRQSLYEHFIRHRMNARVATIRSGGRVGDAGSNGLSAPPARS
ncbi:transglutaminase family protein [Paucibacter sp. APW11]|uniref:Transglutaminase family protein n=1 Tax=Roseateles aquae TaxID=3077235 RepID=A0ABU3P9J2_9BURK|nr:transglutaminase family protein [Paucibacter sp. APW11]MDT8999244.1 transglutaminase family protein [Paucibacter sp. APW11]